MGSVTVCVVGNPNCGKTTLFNGLTGARQRVGNWPGVTVERKAGSYRHRGTAVELVDLPGGYSLGVTSVSSVDERIARDYVLSGEADLVVNIADASNLERNLYLTTQLLEMRVPMIIALNMMDVARDRKIEIDVPAMQECLGCPVVPLVANRGEGVERLRTAIGEAALDRHVPTVEFGYLPEIEDAIVELLPVVSDIATARKLDARWFAIKLLEDDEGVRRITGDVADAILARQQEAVAKRGDEDADILIADGRYGFANTSLWLCQYTDA